MNFSFSVSRNSAGKMAPVITGRNLTPPLPTPMRPEYVRAFRMLNEHNERMARSYDAAMTDNYNTDFKGTYTAPNAELLNSKYMARARARTLAKDTAHGKSIVRTFANNVVGDDPFRLDMRIGEYDADGTFNEDQEINRQIEQEWEIFGWSENFTTRKTMSRMQALRVMEMSVVREGSILLRHHRVFPFNKYGYAIDLLEEDRLQEAYQGKDEDGNPIRFSISWHPRYNFPIYYHVLTRHPGEVFGLNIYGPGSNLEQGQKNFRERVPASDIIHFNNLRDRAEQDVGMTELDSIVQPLWRNQQYSKSLTIAAIASTMKPFVLEKDFPTGIPMSPELMEQYSNAEGTGGLAPNPIIGAGGNDPAASQQNNGQRVNTMRPGMERELPYGVKARILDPKFPIEAAHEFRQDNLRELAVGAGVSYQHVSGDFQNLGFAAALMCQTPMQDYCKIRQRNFIDSVMRPIFKEWLRACIQKDIFDLDIRKLDEYVAAAKFKAKRWAFVNPLVQVQALILKLEAGIMAPQQVQDELPDGVSIEDLYTMYAESHALQQKHGLDFDNEDVTRPTISKGEPGQDVPKAGATEEGGAADTPPKSKTPNPVRGRARRRTRIAPEILEMIGQGMNGEH